MTPEIKIRDYSKNDKKHVLELLRLNTPEFFSAEEEKEFVYYLENEIELYFVVELDRIIIGCGGINFTENNTIGKISWDILHPNFQGKGVGSLLLNYRIERLKTITSITNIIVRTPQVVYKFYEKQGFKLLEVVKDYWVEGFDLYVMEYKK